jgi:hypothetical protein
MKGLVSPGPTIRHLRPTGLRTADYRPSDGSRRLPNCGGAKPPFDDLSRAELLRLVQAYHMALTATRGCLKMSKAMQPVSPYWGPHGSGGSALKKADALMTLCGDGGQNAASEKIYRSFFRVAEPLLFGAEPGSFDDWGIKVGSDEMMAPYNGRGGISPHRMVRLTAAISCSAGYLRRQGFSWDGPKYRPKPHPPGRRRIADGETPDPGPTCRPAWREALHTASWRVSGIGPRYLKFGASKQARVVYPVAEVETWEAGLLQSNTGENRAA